MKWYLKVVRDNYANFEGRARREEYWMFALFNFIFIIGIAILSAILVSLTEIAAFAFLYILYVLAILIPCLAVVVRRLHDIGKSGWYYFIGLIPFIGGIWLLVLMVTEGERGPNQYGPDPKATGDNIHEIGTIA